jgi:hypothetical protein
MAKRALRLATNEGNPVAGKLWQESDEIFFHRSQIKPGVRLMYYGRREHGEVWEVVEVKTYRVAESGRITSRTVDEIVRPTTDDVLLRRISTNETRLMSFYRLSYSAIWRLA